MSTVQLTEVSFETVASRAGLVVVVFTEPGCVSCAAFDPVFERVSEQHPEAVFGRADLETQPALAETFDVGAVPTVMIFRDGVPLVRERGALGVDELELLVRQVGSLDMDRVNQAIAELVREASRAPGSMVQ